MSITFRLALGRSLSSYQYPSMPVQLEGRWERAKWDQLMRTIQQEVTEGLEAVDAQLRGDQCCRLVLYAFCLCTLCITYCIAKGSVETSEAKALNSRIRLRERVAELLRQASVNELAQVGVELRLVSETIGFNAGREVAEDKIEVIVIQEAHPSTINMYLGRTTITQTYALPPPALGAPVGYYPTYPPVAQSPMMGTAYPQPTEKSSLLGNTVLV